ncbi:uncharacterized protein LOC128041829 [Gossypium raimondii]|uniref:uncharacterized protein LOC128041829 n=1 Tax=Gossypium raimondii TaxID=29730 RepID=UPI00227A43BD|nr:uncharacterized protein LOC128041829 [Gossypium raimondii]
MPQQSCELKSGSREIEELIRKIQIRSKIEEKKKFGISRFLFTNNCRELRAQRSDLVGDTSHYQSQDLATKTKEALAYGQAKLTRRRKRCEFWYLTFWMKVCELLVSRCLYSKVA